MHKEFDFDEAELKTTAANYLKTYVPHKYEELVKEKRRKLKEKLHQEKRRQSTITKNVGLAKFFSGFLSYIDENI